MTSYVPFCFYPSTFGYTVTNVQSTSTGITADLHNAQGFSRYDLSPPINDLKLTVTFHENEMVQFKVRFHTIGCLHKQYIFLQSKSIIAGRIVCCYYLTRKVHFMQVEYCLLGKCIM